MVFLHRVRSCAPLALVFAVMAGPALASVALPIGGIFGNETGCAFFMTGEIVTDDFMTLTPDTFTSYGTGCVFDQLLSSSDSVYTVAATCSNEGESETTKDTLKVIDRGVDGVFIEFEGLEAWGPMLPCPGTAALFERGVQV